MSVVCRSMINFWIIISGIGAFLSAYLCGQTPLTVFLEVNFGFFTGIWPAVVGLWKDSGLRVVVPCCKKRRRRRGLETVV